MIIPGFFKDLFKRPVLSLAWILVLTNIVIFIFTSFAYTKWPSAALNNRIKDKNFVVSLSEMYLKTLDPIEKKWLSAKNIPMQALRDDRFWKRIADYPFSGDQVQIEKNRAMLVSFQKEYMSSSQYQLGLGSIETSPWAWVTYQFTHASVTHLLGNIIFIFLIVSYLELKVGFFWLVSIYLLGGFSGGITYLLFEGSGSMAMVGASASASSLMAFLMVTKRNELMPWSYMIAPVPQAYGVIYLPAFFIFPFFLMTDFISALWEPAGVQSSVAVSAHIGGTLCGIFLGAIFLCEEKLKTHFLKLGLLADREISKES